MPRLPAEPRTNELYTLRIAKGWTQAELATRVGCHHITIARLEAKKKLSKRWLLAIEAIKTRS